MLLPTYFFLSLLPLSPALLPTAAAGDAAPVAPVARVPRTPPSPADARALVEKVQRFYERTSDFTARFEQLYSYASFGRKQRSRGQVMFKKPGMMRWDYEKPNPKSFVLAGDRVLALDPAALTLTKAQLGSDQLSAAVTFLFGRGQLLEAFDVRRIDCVECRGTLLELLPRREERFQKLLLEADPETGQVLVSTVVDPDGSTNRIEFLALETNVGLVDERFKLKPPPGTQMVDLTATKP